MHVINTDTSQMAVQGEPSSDPDEGESINPTHLELYRVIDRTKHVSPEDRRKEVDYTVRNTTDDTFHYLFVPLRKFEQNLQVYDEDDTRLNVFPNRVVTEMLDDLADTDPEAHRRIEDRFKQFEYRVFIQLPSDRPIRPGELRTIRLTFEQSEPVEFYQLTDPSLLRGWVSNWRRKFFRIPSFVADVERFPGHMHDVFVVVVGTAGYTVVGETKQTRATDSDLQAELYENGLSEDTRVLSNRLPPTQSRYNWTLQYELVPNNSDLMRLLVSYWAGAVIAGSVSAAVGALGLLSSMSGLAMTVSAGFITVTVSLVFALQADWTDRYRLLSVIPVVVHAIAWLVWS